LQLLLIIHAFFLHLSWISSTLQLIVDESWVDDEDLEEIAEMEKSDDA
jgi:hypothetical protein